MQKLPVFGPKSANCDTCELKENCDKGKVVGAWQPKPGRFNGIMVVGEGPGRHELVHGRPFVGQSGQLLRALFDSYNVNLDDCYVTNATLCVVGTTLVRTIEGLQRIDALVKHTSKVLVETVDNKNRLVYRPITGWYRNALNGRRLFSVSHTFAKGNPRGNVATTVTEDHLVLTSLGWRRADSLTSTHLIATGDAAPGGDTLDMVRGSLLGDSCVTTRSSFKIGHCKEQSQYFERKRELLEPLGLTPVVTRSDGFQSLVTRASAYWREARQQWYSMANSNRRLVPPLEDLAEWNDASFAYWYFDDGHLHHNRARKNAAVRLRMTVRIKSKTQEEKDRLAFELTRRGYACHVQKNGETLVFSTEGAKLFGRAIAKYATHDVAYKLLPEHRKYVGTWRPTPGSKVFFAPAVVREVKPRAQDRTVYCLEVDQTHNFVTPAVVVHNCYPPPTGGKKSFHQRFPNAVYSCLPRLEKEVQAVRPRVILAFGAAAMTALTGYEEHYTKRLPFTCDNCDPVDRKIGPVIECSAKNAATGEPCKERYWADEAPENCITCGHSLKRYKPKRVKCPVCRGLKTRETALVRFKHDYKISEVAGAVIAPDQHSWGTFGVKYIIPTLHPSFLLRTSKDPFAGQFIAKAVQKHIRKGIHLVKNDEDWGFEYETTAGAHDTEAAEHLLEYIYGNKTVAEFACDIETEAWSANRETELDATEVSEVSDITCIGFASRQRGYALVVDVRELAHGNFKALGKSRLFQALRQVLTDLQLRLTFHNGVYDVPVIGKLWGFRVTNYANDTQLQHHVLAPDEPHRLSHVAFSYTYCKIWKPPKERKGVRSHESFEELVKYNARDVMVTDECREAMTGSLERKKLTQVHDLDMKLQQQALTMHFNGMYVSKESALKVGKKALGESNEALCKMRDILGEGDFNPNATKQLTWALFSKLQFTPVDHTEGGAPSTAASSIKKLPDHPFKTALLDYVAANSVLKAYYEVSYDKAWEKDAELQALQPRGNLVVPARGLCIWPDSRVHPIWKPYARTGRFVSNPNFQNIPKWFRSLIVAPPGRKIIGADYDQLELRILAALSGDEVLLDKCLNADEKRKLEPECDPHSYVAKFAFGDAYTRLHLKDPMHNNDDKRCRCETCQRKALRDLCKRVIYGLNYGAGDEKVLESIYDGGYEGPQITLQMIGRVRKAIFTAFRRILPFQQRLIKDANENQFISDAIVGRKRFFPLGDIPVTEIKNFIIQSTGASIINLRNTLLYDQINSIDPTALYMAQVHDAVYYEVDEAKAEALLPLFDECLTWETSLYKGGPRMRFSASGVIADDWKAAA